MAGFTLKAKYVEDDKFWVVEDTTDTTATQPWWVVHVGPDGHFIITSGKSKRSVDRYNSTGRRVANAIYRALEEKYSKSKED